MSKENEWSHSSVLTEFSKLQAISKFFNILWCQIFLFSKITQCSNRPKDNNIFRPFRKTNQAIAVGLAGTRTLLIIFLHFNFLKHWEEREIDFLLLMTESVVRFLYQKTH